MNEKRFEVIQNSGNLLSETLKDPKSLLYYNRSGNGYEFLNWTEGLVFYWSPVQLNN